MKKIFFIFFFIFTLAFVYGKDVPFVSKGDIIFYTDWCSLKGSDNKTYQEFYLAAFADQLSASDSGNALINISVSIYNNKGDNVYKKNWDLEVLLPSDSLKSLSAVQDMFNAEFLPGNYKVKITIEDTHSGKEGESEFELEIPDMSNEEISRIKFMVPVTNASGKMNKVKVNPTRRYGIFNPIMSFNYELYPRKAIENGSADYMLVNSSGETVKKLNVNINKVDKNQSFTHAFDVSTIPSGIYNLKIEIKDGDVVKSTTFRSLEIIQADYASSQPAITEDEAKTSGEIIEILSPEKYRIYESLNLSGKAGFLVNYWKQNDPSPGTPENEYREKIVQRFQYASKNFSWGKEKGFKSDRGKILLRYGNPDEISAHHAEPGTAPYEIWNYQKEKNYYFVFADLQSNGHFVLVHSTKEGEIKNSDWQFTIRKAN